MLGPPNRELVRRLRSLEGRLAASERRYRQLVEAASAAILVADRDCRLVEANKAACELLGYRRDELLTLAIDDLLVADASEERLRDRLQTGETISGFRRMRRKDGTLVEVEGSAKILPDGRFQAILRDVGERRQMEEALRESEQRLRRLTASTRAVVYRYRVRPDRRLEFISPEVTALTGFTPDELYVDPELVWGRVHPEDRGLVGEPFTPVTIRYARRDGKLIWFERLNLPVHDENGELVAIEGVARDITDQKQQEQALQASEELLRAVFENAVVAIVVVGDDRALLDANAPACDLFGRTKEELVGTRLDELTPSESREQLNARWLEFGAAGELTAQLSVVRPDGSRREVEYGARANVLPGRHVAVMQDVTERLALAERLRQSERMEAVGRLAGGVAHDFNNLLTVITGYGEVLERRLTDEAARREVNEIRRAAARASALTSQLLAYSRRQVLQPRALDLNDVMRDLERMLRRLVGERIELSIQLADALEPVLADDSRVEQVIVNLAVNARDAMPAGGTLTISTANVELHEPLPALGESLAPGRYVRLSVEDTGVGIPPEILTRIFEPFFTTKEQARGTGLGLATVYGIARQSGGAVLVESEVGAGTRFDVFLPCPGVGEPPLTLAEPQRPARAGSETVLLVEDDDLVRDLVREVLAQSGYEVLEAREGEEALALAERHRGPIDLVLTDVVMPTMSGRELAARIAEAQPGVKVLYTSGYAEDAPARAGEVDDGAPFLQKPFTLDALTSKVREVLDAARD